MRPEEGFRLIYLEGFSTRKRGQQWLEGCRGPAGPPALSRGGSAPRPVCSQPPRFSPGPPHCSVPPGAASISERCLQAAPGSSSARVPRRALDEWPFRGVGSRRGGECLANGLIGVC